MYSKIAVPYNRRLGGELASMTSEDDKWRATADTGPWDGCWERRSGKQWLGFSIPTPCPTPLEDQRQEDG